jgi:hypothetical protein
MVRIKDLKALFILTILSIPVNSCFNLNRSGFQNLAVRPMRSARGEPGEILLLLSALR